MRFALTPITSGVGALLNASTLLLAVRGNQLESIAGFSAGLSIVALGAVALGGGTTLVFTSGSLAERTAVRWVRTRVVLPAATVLAILGSIGLSAASDLVLAYVFCGGLAALLNNLSEIESSFLRRQLATPTLTIVDIVARGLSLTLVALGAPFHVAMLVGAAARQSLLIVYSWRDPSRRTAAGAPVRQHLKRAYNPSLYGTALAYIFLDRSTFIVAPLISGAEEAGIYASFLMLVQSAAGLLVTGLQTLLAGRSSGLAHRRAALAFEATILAVALLVPLLLTAGSNFVIKLLDIPSSQGSSAPMLIVMSTYIPVAVLGRLIQFRLIAQGERRSGFLLTLCSALVLVVLLSLTMLLQIPLIWLAAALVAAEVSGLALAVAMRPLRGRE